MSLALDSVALGVSDDDEATTRLVAEKIIEAGHGMRGATLHAALFKQVEENRRKA